MPKLRDKQAIELLAGNLKRYRLEQELTQEELANKAGVEFSTISRIERGLLNASISLVFALAKALEIEPTRLLKKKEEAS